MIDLGSTILNTVLGAIIMALASSLNLYLQGKITGISGAIFRTITLKDFSYNSSFLLGMIFISSFIKYFFDPLAKTKKYDSPKFMENTTKYVSDLSLPGFIIAGFLVGFGAKMANGCTSGHGVCGLPRLSKRSFVAIMLFMIFGILMATIRYNIPFLRPTSFAYVVWEDSLIYQIILIFSLMGLGLNLLYIFKNGIKDKIRDILINFFIGALFGFGLIQSGMTQRHVVIEFLTIGKIWNIQMAVVFGVVVSVNIGTFNYILKKIEKPRFKEIYDLPTNTKVDNKLCVGSAIFGLGWGLGGICPGPAVLACYLYCPQILAFLISLCFGIYIEYAFDKKISDLINNSNLNSKEIKYQKIGTI